MARDYVARSPQPYEPPLEGGDLWSDVWRSALSGGRRGLESIVGAPGDVANLNVDALSGLAGLFSPAAQGVVEKARQYVPLPSSEAVGKFTDKAASALLPEEAAQAVEGATRHEPASPFGQGYGALGELIANAVGDPGPAAAKLLGDLAPMLAMAVMPGRKITRAAPVREAESVGDTLAAVTRPSPDGTIGDLDNPPVMFEGVSPGDFTGTEQWHRFGQQYGVPNLGSPSEMDWLASLAPYKTKSGMDFTVPGGAESKDPFTYYDLLHLKQQGINPNDIPPELHQAIHDRMTAAMSQGEMTPERIMNQLSLAQISPNQPLTPNELAVARTMVKGPQDIKKLGGMVPWHHSDDPATSGAKDVVSSRVNEKGKTINMTRRQQLSSEIANRLGLGAGNKQGTGGLGARGTADYTRIAETAQRIDQDPDFFRFRGAEEGGATSSENWANFVERLANQTPGLSSKTGSFGGVWQNPAQADISAIDRHMATMFKKEMFPSEEAYQAFEKQTLDRFKKANPGSKAESYDALPQAFKNDQMFGYLNNNPGMVYRGKPAKGSNSGVGAVNPNVPEHLQPDQARWVEEPAKIETISEPYRRVLDAVATEARKNGQSVFAAQWMLWDRIRNRLEPHEIMFPGLEKLPRYSMDQMRRVRQDLAEAGYMSGTKTVDELTGEPTGLQPVRPLPSASRAAYFTLPTAAVGGAATMQALEERKRERERKPQGASS